MKTLIASLALLLAAAPAMAQPGYEHRAVVLARASFGADGRASVEPNMRGRFRQIQLASAEHLYITEVAIMYADGSEQVAKDMSARIDAGHPLTLDLAGGAREIKRVVVYGPAGRVRGNVTLRGLE